MKIHHVQHTSSKLVDAVRTTHGLLWNLITGCAADDGEPCGCELGVA